MYSILVLGLIPGTNIQISFQAWLAILAVLTLLAPFLKRYVSRLVKFGKETAASYEAPHASLLHHRQQRTAR
jgi:hypothetical protein